MPQTGSRPDPIPGFRLRVEIDNKVVAWFTECSGLGAERQVDETREGGVNDHAHQLPKGITYPRVTLRRGLIDEELWAWFQAGLYDAKVERKDVAIELFCGDRQSVTRWELAKAFPTKWTGPELRADSNSVAIETLELVHQGLKITKWAKP
jgi:phage tail-like protein